MSPLRGKSGGVLRDTDESLNLGDSSGQSGGSILPVSVIIPAHNRVSTLGRALASVTAQRRVRPAEVIVIDDGSTDGTPEVAERVGAVVVRHDKNRGASAARNSGLAAANQPWVALLDSDDEWLPDHLATVWGMRDGHVLVADTELCCGDDPLRYRRFGTLTRTPQRLSDPAPLLFPGNRIATSGTLIRRESLVQAGGFRDLKRASDFDMWLRLLEQGTALLSPRVGVIYHLHDERLTADESATRMAHVEVARGFATRPWFSEKLIERWWGLVIWDRTRHALRNGHFGDVARGVLRLAANPQRIFGATRFAVSRTRYLRASARTARNGQPSLAVLIREAKTRAQALEAFSDRPVVDLSDQPRASAYAQLLHRPTSLAVVDSAVGTILLRLAGIRTVRTGAGDEEWVA